MKSRETITAYFIIDNQTYQLFTVTNIKSEETPDLKFSGFSHHYFSMPTRSVHDVGRINYEEFKKAYFVNNMELTYHNNGAMMVKIVHNDGSEFHHNPYGRNTTWTPFNEIKGVQPIIVLNLRDIELCKKVNLKQENDLKHNYICDTDELFNVERSYFVFIYIKEYAIDILRITSDCMYSDVICSINKDLDLCIFINVTDFDKHNSFNEAYILHEEIVNPEAYNTYSFCDKEAISNMINTEMDFIFDKRMCSLVNNMSNGKVWKMTEENMKKLKEQEVIIRNTSLLY